MTQPVDAGAALHHLAARTGPSEQAAPHECSSATQTCVGCDQPLSRYNRTNCCQACVSASRQQQSSGTGTPTPDEPEIGKRLAELRRQRGLTQEVLAGRAGVSVSIVQKLESNDRQWARLRTLSALSCALKVPVSALLKTPGQAGQPDKGYENAGAGVRPRGSR